MTEATHLLSEAALKTVHRQSMNNRSTLTGRCGCFYCLSTFIAERVTDWADGGQTALCPVCGIDAVLSSVPTPITGNLLRQMRDHWFGTLQPLPASEWDQAVATDEPPRAPG